MTILQSGIAQAAAGGGGYQIARSLRFNSADSAYLSRTPGSASNRKTWTWSANIKRSALDTEQFLFDCSLALNETSISFSTGNTLVIYAAVAGSVVVNLITTQVFRDVGAHMNIQLTADTTQATAANRLKLYINGVQVTAFSTATYCAQNTDLIINTANAHSIGRNTNGANRYASMYFSDMRLVDGQALDPTSFGEFDANTGVWNPKTYAGTYGTNGFWLPFSDNTGADSFGIGTDTSASALNRVELGNTSVGYAVLGTMTYSSGGAAAVNLRDNNPSTSAADPNGINASTAMGYDFGRAIKIRKITTLTDASSGMGATVIFNIQYSDNNSTWTTVTGSATTHTISAGTSQSNSTSIDDNGSHRYWRLFYLSGTTGGNCWIATLDMFVNSIGPNSWYPVNFSVTAGVGNDSLVDSPTNYGTDTGAGGEVRGNYCTLNPLDRGSDWTAVLNGNLDGTVQGATGHSIRSTMAVSSGKWYWEFTNANNLSAGIIEASKKIVPASTSYWPGGGGFGAGGSYGYFATSGLKYTNETGTSYGATFTTTDVIGCALDMDNGKIYWSKNGVWQASGDPAAGTNAAFTGISGTFSPAWGYIGAGAGTLTCNFGQRPFAYTAPSGFKALCTQNLPTPAIGATSSTLASKNMNVVTYTGDGTNNRNITGVGFQPDLVWVKSRSNTYDHQLVDAVRGGGKELYSNLTNAESTLNTIPAFISDGFQVNGGTYAGTNGNGATFVGWAFKGANTTVSNTSGTITSTVSANPTAGISVIGWTSTGSNGTIGHGLGAAPAFIIARRRNITENWLVYHKNMGGNNGHLLLNSSAAFSTASAPWNSTDPTSTVISVNNTGLGAGTGNPMITYAFAEVAGFSKFGSYTGNGSADGPFVYCGFRPRYVMIKCTSSAGTDWVVIDTARDTYNGAYLWLRSNTSGAEESISTTMDVLSNGFKMRYAGGTAINNSGSTYIFAAFSESPFNYSRAR